MEKCTRVFLLNNMKIKTFTLFLLLALPAVRDAAATARLPRLVSDGKVLQRGQPVRIWGWAGAGEAVAVTFRSQTYRAVTGPDGQWRVTLPAVRAGVAGARREPRGGRNFAAARLQSRGRRVATGFGRNGLHALSRGRIN